MNVTVRDANKNMKEVLLGLRKYLAFLKKVKADKELVSSLEKLVKILKKYENVSLSEIDKTLESHFGKNKLEHISKLGTVNISFDDFQNIEIRKNLSKEELILTAEKELGISKSRLNRLSREKIEIKIENAFENLHALNTISKIASKQV